MLQYIYNILCETWLRPHHKLKFKEYNMVRLDLGNYHNGVAILIHVKLNYSILQTQYDDSLQNIAIRLKYHNKELSIVSIYSPGNCTPQFSKRKLNNLIDNIPEPIFIAGDFNARHLLWGCSSIDSRGRDVYESLNENNLVILNNGSPTTVGSHIWQPNALDLTMVSPALVLNCEWMVTDDPLGSFHLPVITKILLNICSHNSGVLKSQNQVPFPHQINCKNIDFKKYTKKLDNLLLNHNFDSGDPLRSYVELTDIINVAAKECLLVPHSVKHSHINLTSKKLKKQRIPLPWWNQTCANAVTDAKQAYLAFKENPSELNYLTFKRKQALRKLILNNERKLSWYSLTESFNRTTSLSYIWSMMRKFNKKPKTNNNTTNTDLISSFLMKYTPDTVEHPLDLCEQYTTASNVNNLTNPFSLAELNAAISSRRDTVCGLDGIPYKMIKCASTDVRKLILDIYNSLWINNLIPTQWKTDCLIPVLKPFKDKDNHESYRPITLTSCMGKIFEQLLKQRLEFYIERNHILPSNQFGLWKGRSSRESISHLQLDIFRSFKQHNPLFAVFFDITGAFNNVNLHILSKELMLLGIPKKIVIWIFNFLHGREVYVKVENFLLGPRESYKGVCQGGILSPLVFLLYINKLNCVLGSGVSNLQYADDLVVYASGSDPRVTVNQLNNSLKKLSNYFSYLNLDINADKTKVVVFNGAGTTQKNYKVFYNHSELVYENSVKFLGVTFMKNMSWNKYVELIKLRASKALNIIKSLSSTYWGSDPKILLNFYKSLVRSQTINWSRN